MKRDVFLAGADVEGFLTWIAPRLSGDRAFTHEWQSPRFGHWSCTSIYDAFQNYTWPFSATLPGDSEPTRGRTFAENLKVLRRLSYLLRSSADDGNAEVFLATAVAIVDWGGVRRNRQRLGTLGTEALPTIVGSAEYLAPATADTTHLKGVSDMNAGFTKIYSLLLDRFPIYDSRVAASLAYLVRLYSEEAGLARVPSALAFGIPASRGSGNRDPSTPQLRFPRLWPAQPRKYADSNLRAAWLLGQASRLGPFGDLPEDEALRALEAALFMVGFAVPGTPQIRSN